MAHYLAETERLWGAEERTPSGDRLDVLSTLVEAHEEAHSPIEMPDPIEAIKFRPEQQGEDKKLSWESSEIELVSMRSCVAVGRCL